MKESPLEQLLKGRSPEFKDTVRALVQQYDIDETDPTFILLVGTSTLEALLTKYPQQFESLFISLLAQMNQRWETLQQEIASVTHTASEKLAADWQQLHLKLSSSAMDTATTAHKIDSRLHEVKELLDTEVKKVESLLQQQREGLQKAAATEQETIRVQAGTQAELLTTVFEGQAKELEVQAGKLAAHAIATAQANMQQQIKEFNKGIKWKHYLEAAGLACGCAALLMATSWTTAWVSRGRVENNTVWSDIERWNGDELQACLRARTPTCNFHIERPKETAQRN
ncbi:hypothetical protein S7335_1090 [Synechococcus sp. PCC 7335]|uniref:DUF6753 family protein n=1 Tax=Synechococcus sp. (strain ATCC 29403 / PCC 7335) TaxID=91464 RepID=UPI00017EC828|nr:DUF6753 family protein [Synechococcus sp. PCC 7335]EDX82787.1 hypothetical protein S7335_1090 [Synechococcus sp. PCC 7335]